MSVTPETAPTTPGAGGGPLLTVDDLRVGFATEAGSCLIQEFPAHTDGLKAIAAFLREHQVNTIALESTGI